MQLLNITTCCATASVLWVGIVRPLHNYALFYGAAHCIALTVLRRQVPGRSSPLGVGDTTGCKSEAAFANSVSHTSFHLSLLFGGGSADIEEHINPSKAVLAACGRRNRRS